MRAWVFTSRGSPRNILRLDLNYPAPGPPEDDELLIKVSHVALNPGSMVNMAMIPPIVRRWLFGSASAVAEGEFSGVVKESGPDAPATLSPGTRVFGNIPMMRLIAGSGTLAEYITMPLSSVAVVPADMSMAKASCLSGAGQTALDMISSVDIKEGKRVLVNGSTGGVGIMAVQIAKAKGAYVVATCSEASYELVKSLGADEVVDYRRYAPLSSHLANAYCSNPFDYVLDTVGSQDLFIHSPAYLRSDGHFVNVGNFEGVVLTVWRSILNTYLPALLGGVPRRYLFVAVSPTGSKAQLLADMAEEGRLKVIVDDVVDFEDVISAYERLARRRTKGKIVVKVEESQ